MSLIEVQVPDIGDFDEVTVIELMVKVGDTVKAEQSLITVESDKASMEIPSSSAGVVKEMRVVLGDKVKQGSIVLVLEAAAAAAPSAAPSAVIATAAPASGLAVTEAKQSTPSVIASEAKQSTSQTSGLPRADGPRNDVAASGPVQVHVPDIGDFKDVAVIEVFVKPGDSIKVEQSLITVESDKASMEIPSSHAGVLKELKVKVGDTVNIGDLLAILEGTVSGAASVAAASASVMATAAPASGLAVTQAPPSSPAAGLPRADGPRNDAATPAHAPGAPALGLPHASPSVRKFARELGANLRTEGEA